MQNETKRARRFFDGAFALAVAAVVTKILGLLYKAPLSRILGDEGMGYFNSAYTVYTFFYILCSAGVPKAVAIVISENDAKTSGKGERRIVSASLLLFLMLGAAFTAIFLCFSDELCEAIGNSGAHATMLAIAPSVLFVSLAGVAKGYLNGHSKLVPIAVSQLIEGGAKFFLGIFFAVRGAERGMSLPVLSGFTVLGITLGSIISSVYLLICTARSMPKERKNRDTSVPAPVGRIIKIAIPLTVGAAVMSISGMIDLATVMGGLTRLGYSEAEASALYGNYTTLAVPMFNLVVALISPFFVAALPMLSRSYVAADKLGFEEELGVALEKAFFIAVPSCIAFIFYSEELLSVIFERSAARLGAPLLTLLAPALVFLVGQTLVNTALEAAGHYKAPVITMLIGAVPKLAISHYLISDASFGISGAPIGTVVCYAVGFLASVVILYTRTDIHVPIVRPIARPLISAFSALAVSELILRTLFARVSGILLYIGTVAVFAVLYLLFSAILLFSAKKPRVACHIVQKKREQFRQ